MAQRFFHDDVTDETIDARIYELDMEKLRGLAREYNEREEVPEENRIDLARYGNDKLKLIIALWQRFVEIPPYWNITYGQPYDTIFSTFSLPDNEDDGTVGYENELPLPGEIPPVEETLSYQALTKADKLMYFLPGYILFPGDSKILDPVYNLHRSFRILNDELGKDGISNFTDRREFVKLLPKLKPFVIAYLFLELTNIGGFHEDTKPSIIFDL